MRDGQIYTYSRQSLTCESGGGLSGLGYNAGMMPYYCQRIINSLLFGVLLCGSLACTGPSERKTEEPQASAPAQPVTARFAFQRMYILAKTWSADAQPTMVANLNLKGIPCVSGKCPAWRGTFVSVQLRKALTYTFSVVNLPGIIREGAQAGRDDPWAGPTGPSRPFIYQMLKVDSDQAYQVAAKESAPYLKKHPNLPVQFQLEFTNRFPTPAWRVMWGETVGSSNYSVFVDSISGHYLQTLH